MPGGAQGWTEGRRRRGPGKLGNWTQRQALAKADGEASSSRLRPGVPPGQERLPRARRSREGKLLRVRPEQEGVAGHERPLR